VYNQYVFSINICINKRFKQNFENEIEKQIPFATALALTTIAGMARAEIRRELPREFVIRNSFTARGIVTEMAKASDWPNCYSVVGSRDEYMAAHEDGGTREKENKAFAIPYAIRENLRDLIPRRLWPGRLLGKADAKMPGGGRIRNSKNGSARKPKPFLMRRGGYVGVYVRTNSTAVVHGKTKQKLKLLYRLDKHPIHLKQRHWLTSAVERTVSERADDAFYRALSRALRE
jgi:hypothetical protein